MSKTKLSLSFLIYSLIYPSFVHADNIIGPIANPLPQYPSLQGQGLFLFLGNILKLVGTIAGLYMIIQIITAGFIYISADGDPKKIQQAWDKIWQSILGLIVIASAFVIASIVERFTGISILTPTIYGPPLQ